MDNQESRLDGYADATGAVDALYPIRTVATLTGVNPITLRAWERRYGLIKPRRTEKGHRLYSAQDVDFIRHVVAVLDTGVPISQVRAGLRASPPGIAAFPQETPDPWARHRQRMTQAIARFDENALEDGYNEALALYPVDIVTRHLIVPLLRALGERWSGVDGGIAEEHFFAVYLRNKLGARFHHRARSTAGPKLLVSCLPGEHHEVGVLLFALCAHDRGYRLVLLGADMPLGDLPTATVRSGSDAIVLSGSVAPPPRLVNRHLPDLVRNAVVPVFVGGVTSAMHCDGIARAGAIPVGDDIQIGLRRIGEVLGYAAYGQSGA